jgi:hypothetical protein
MVRGRKQVHKALLDMKTNEITIHDPIPNTILKSNNLVAPPTHNGGRMEKLSVPISFHNPTHSRLKGPKIFLKFEDIEIILSKGLLNPE